MIATVRLLVAVAVGTYVLVIVPVEALEVNEMVCEPFPKVTATPVDVTAAYLVSAAIVAEIKHVPIVVAVNVGVVEVLLLSEQPVAVPLAAAYVFAPVPVDPEGVKVKACEYADPVYALVIGVTASEIV